MSAGTIIWWQENIEQVAQVSPSSVSLCSFFISFLFRFSHPKQFQTKAKHSWGFIHIPAITHTQHQHTSQQQGCFFLPISRLAAAPTPRPSCFSAGIFAGFPPGTFCGFPAIPTCSFHKPKGCCECHEIREFRHQRERKAGAFHSLSS